MDTVHYTCSDTARMDFMIGYIQQRSGPTSTHRHISMIIPPNHISWGEGKLVTNTDKYCNSLKFSGLAQVCRFSTSLKPLKTVCASAYGLWMRFHERQLTSGEKQPSGDKKDTEMVEKVNSSLWS